MSAALASSGLLENTIDGCKGISSDKIGEEKRAVKNRSTVCSVKRGMSSYPYSYN